MDIEHIIDFNLFQVVEAGDECGGTGHGHCNAVERVIAALDYHQFLVNGPLDAKYGDDPMTAFVSFCDELYSKKTMLNDYVHFVEHHAAPQSIEYIRNRLHFQCESAKKCGATSRHFRDRRDHDVEAEGMEVNWFIDRVDSIHFMVHHLTELGLRVPMHHIQSELALPDDDEEQQHDESHLVNRTLQRMAEIIESKRATFSTERLDKTVNSKFTLQIDGQKQGGHGVGSDGMSSLFRYILLEDILWNLR